MKHQSPIFSALTLIIDDSCKEQSHCRFPEIEAIENGCEYTRCGDEMRRDRRVRRGGSEASSDIDHDVSTISPGIGGLRALSQNLLFLKKRKSCELEQ